MTWTIYERIIDYKYVESFFAGKEADDKALDMAMGRIKELKEKNPGKEYNVYHGRI